MPRQLKVRRDTSSDFQTANPTLAAGEFAYETDTEKIKVGDGSTAYNSLQFIDGDDAASLGPHMQGSSYGYSLGGNPYPASPSYTDKIERYSFASNGNGSDVGDLAIPGETRNVSNTTHAYSISFYNPPIPSTNNSDVVKTAFSNHASSIIPALNSGSLYPPSNSYFQKHSAIQSTTDAFVDSGRQTPPATYFADIHKFPFSSENAWADTGANLANARWYANNTASTTHGYSHAGKWNPASSPNSPLYSTDIQKYPFSISSGTSSTVGTNGMSSWGMSSGGASSSTHGYIIGGWESDGASSDTTVMHKYSFSSDGNSAFVGSITEPGGAYGMGNSNSPTHGYSHGGGYVGSPSFGSRNTIENFPFSSDSNASDVGDLTQINRGMQGQVQV